MKLVINLSEDAELRAAILGMVREALRTDVREIIREEAKAGVGGNIRDAVIQDCREAINIHQLRVDLRNDLNRDTRRELVNDLRPVVLREVVEALTGGK